MFVPDEVFRDLEERRLEKRDDQRREDQVALNFVVLLKCREDVER
jgi:hypothetical protein